MARYTDTTPISAEWLKDYADHLRRVATMLDGNREQMVGSNISEISATHHQTSQEAIKKLQKFAGAIAEALANYAPPKSSKKVEKPAKK